MKLVIVESPTKGRTIQRYLGNDYRVVASQGHVRDLSLSGEGSLGVDIKNNFEPEYIVIPTREKIITYIKSLVKEASIVYLASDPDREGEAIAWHLYETLELKDKESKRLVFNEITKKAINEAIEKAKEIDLDLVKSQETRRILDRIIGFKLSNLLQKKIKTRSAGRVQSVALKIINEKEKEIKAFKEEISFGVEGNILKNKEEIRFDLVDNNKKKIKLTDKKDLEELLKLEGKNIVVDEINITNSDKYPLPPYITSTMQQDAFSKYHFSAAKTMKVAQQLYEGIKLEKETVGLITYMRTDSIRLSSQFYFNAKDFIVENFGEDYMGFAKTQKEKANVQDAHEAIRPTHIEKTPEDIKEFLTPDQYKLYRIIYYRALCSLMKNALIENQEVIFKKDNNLFVSEGKRILFDGYYKLFNEFESSTYKSLPLFKVNEEYKIEKIEVQEHKTRPPFRYSEGSLIKKMEDLGIGRPSTYASIIESLKKSGYVLTQKGYLLPTEAGELSDEKLAEFFSSIINTKYTANMEKDLDLIAEGKLTRKKALNEFYNPFEKLLVEANKTMKSKELELTGEKCPLCESDLVYRAGRYGKFVSCSNYPTCKYTPKKEIEIPSDSKDCPKCKDGKLIERKGKYGNFLGCSNFPKCHHMEKIEKK